MSRFDDGLFCMDIWLDGADVVICFLCTAVFRKFIGGFKSLELQSQGCCKNTMAVLFVSEGLLLYFSQL